MGSFKRENIGANKIDIKRLQPDMKVEMGAGEIKHLQAVAQNKTDGLFYPYVAGDTDKGVIVGLYTGEDGTLTAKDLGLITTYAIVAKESIQGITWESDKTAVSQLKLAGIILTNELKGTKEA